MEHFNEIKPEDKMQGMNRLHLQLMIFKSILTEILESPALVDYTASVTIINRMDTALQNLLQCLEQVQNGEQVNQFAALEDLETTFTSVAQYLKQIESIIHVDHVLDATLVIVKNIQVAKIVLQDMFMVAAKLTDYPTTVFPQAQLLMQSISAITTLETDEMKAKLQNLKNRFQVALTEYATAKPNQKQEIVDKSYEASVDLFHDVLDSDVFQNSLLALYDFIMKYNPFVTFPTDHLSFTSIIAFPSVRSISNVNVKDLVKDVYSYSNGHSSENIKLNEKSAEVFKQNIITDTSNLISRLESQTEVNLSRFLRSHITAIRENLQNTSRASSNAHSPRFAFVSNKSREVSNCFSIKTQTILLLSLSVTSERSTTSTSIRSSTASHLCKTSQQFQISRNCSKY